MRSRVADLVQPASVCWLTAANGAKRMHQKPRNVSFDGIRSLWFSPRETMADAGQRNEAMHHADGSQWLRQRLRLCMRHVGIVGAVDQHRGRVGGVDAAQWAVAFEPNSIGQRITPGHFLQPPALLPAIQVEQRAVSQSRSIRAGLVVQPGQ